MAVTIVVTCIVTNSPSHPRIAFRYANTHSPLPTPHSPLPTLLPTLIVYKASQRANLRKVLLLTFRWYRTQSYNEGILQKQHLLPPSLLFATQIVQDGVCQYEACDPGQEYRNH